MEERQGSLHDATVRETSATEATPETSKRKRQPRNSACQSCSGLKMKCCPSPVPGCCERCNRMNKQCIPAVPKPRKRRSTNGFADDHAHGVRITDLLDDSVSPERGSRTIPTWTSSIHQPGTSHHHSSPAQAAHSPKRRFEPIVKLSLRSDEHNERDVLERLDETHVRRSVDRFRTYLDVMPIVDLGLLDDVSHLVGTRPMTVLSICCVTSTADLPMHEELDNAYRRSLADAVVVNGERSIDLIHSVLIYLNYSWRAARQADLMYSLLHLLASMVHDVGLPRRDAKAAAQGFELQCAALSSYITAFHITRFGYNRVSPIPWTDALQKCADSVCASSASDSPRRLTALLTTARVLDDFITTTERSKSLLNASAMMAVSPAHAESSLRRLQSCKGQLASDYDTSAYATASIYLQSRASLQPNPPLATSLHDLTASVTTYLEGLVTTKGLGLRLISLPQIVQLLSIIAVLPRLYSSWSRAGGQGRDLGVTRHIYRPVELLEQLLPRLYSDCGVDDGDRVRDDVFKLIEHAVKAVSHRIQNHEEQATTSANGTFRAVNYERNVSDERHGTKISHLKDVGIQHHEIEPCGGVLDMRYWDTLAEADG